MTKVSVIVFLFLLPLVYAAPRPQGAGRVPLHQSACEEPEVIASIGSKAPGHLTRGFQDALEAAKLRIAELEKQKVKIAPLYRERFKKVSAAWLELYDYNSIGYQGNGHVYPKLSPSEMAKKASKKEHAIDWAKHLLKKGVARPKDWDKEDKRYGTVRDEKTMMWATLDFQLNYLDALLETDGPSHATYENYKTVLERGFGAEPGKITIGDRAMFYKFGLDPVDQGRHKWQVPAEYQAGVPAISRLKA